MPWRTSLLGTLLLYGVALADDSAALSGMAAGMLQETNQARAAITSNDKESALRHVNQALSLISDIEAQAGSQAKPLKVTVSKELATESTYVPVKRKKSDVMSANRLKKTTSISQVSGEMTRSLVDVTAAREHLEGAKAALENGNLRTADTDLAAVQKSVVNESVQGDMPLLRVKENLMLAKARIQESKPKAAAMPLRAAARALADYRVQAPAANSAEAEVMRQEMESLAENIKRGHAVALDRIAAWSEKIDAWVTQATK